MGMYQIERIELEGPQNVRDLGGFEMLDGRRIRNGRLIRSCELHRLTESDKAVLINDHHLRTVVDFRTGLEREQLPDPDLQGVSNQWIPVLDESMLGVTREEGADQDTIAQLSVQIKNGQMTTERFMKKLYSDIVHDAHAARAYRQFFDVLLEQQEGAVLWHCSAGKDRAGMAALLVLTALAAPRELIIEDYLMVNIFLKENIEYNRQRVIQRTGDVHLADAMTGLFSVERAYVEYIFFVMDEEFGSAQAYLEKVIGMTAEECVKLQEMYLL